MKKKICFIINPISGVGQQKTVERLVEQRLNKLLFDYEIKYTQAAKHATALATKAVNDNFDMVVAVGGDGSVNEVAKGLINTNVTMAILPAGSGNGLARHLSIPLNLKKAINLINVGKTKNVDTAQLNNETFINVAGVGFDAHIGWMFSKYPKRGFASYIKLVLKEFPSYKNQDFKLIIDGQEIYKSAFLITLANGSQWGNNAYISPHSINDDGVFEIAILKDVSIFNFPYLAVRLFTKTLDRSSHLEILKAKELIINQTNGIAHIDGEPIESGKSLAIKINPLSLKIIVP